MKEKLKQYKNLIFVVAAVILVLSLLIVDPAGYFAERRQIREQIQNQIAIEKAETDKRIAIIRAETIAEQMRIREEAGISVRVLDEGIEDIRDEIQGTQSENVEVAETEQPEE